MMKKIFFVLMVAVLITACNQEEVIVPQTYSVTGYSQTQVKSRTYFYEDWITESPEGYDPWTNGLIFLWNEDDCIWVGNEKSTSTTLEEDESATFGGFTSNPAGQKVYYNMTGGTATQAYVLAEQDVNRHLGLNGDFAYAEMTAHDDGNFFELEHATSYIWFDVLNLLEDENATLILNSITLDAGVNIAGKATWNESSFGEISEGSSKITLNVNKEIGTNETLFPMVVFPVDLNGRNVNVTYKFTLDGETKFYQQKLPGKKLNAGFTQMVLPLYLDDESGEPLLTDYELRVLTFEDDDVKFGEYMFYNGNGDEEYIETWSQLIPENQWYMGSPLIYNMGEDAEYEWMDKGNTELCHKLPLNYGIRNFAGGGMVVSSHTVPLEDLQEYTIYDYQLSVTTGSGHNGSSNFCVAYNCSEVDYDAAGLEKNTLSFGDGVARVIDHMYVTIVAPTHYCITYGNSFSSAYGDDDFLKLVATGIKADDTKTEPVEILLAEGADMKLTDWTRWDLSSLGKIKAVEFHMEEAQFDTWGNASYWRTPMYFAFDDVAVRFE